MPEPTEELKSTLEYKLTPATPEEKEEDNIYEYQQKIKLTPEQETEIVNIIDAELEVIDNQRAVDDSENRWDEYENQYWGVVQDNPNTTFNLHQFLTLKHVRRVKSRLYQAFFESDPIYSVSPRPEYAKKEGYETAERQEQFLDYEFDSEIIIKSPMRKVFHESTLKDGGIAKVIWERDQEWIRRREKYEGTEEGLQSFLTAYPDAETKYPGLVKQLQEGNDIDITSDKREIIYDAPRIYFIPFKNFYINLNTEGLLGLRKTKFFAELQKYTWPELQEEIEEGRFDQEATEALKWFITKDSEVIINPTYLEEEYTIFECNLFYDLKKNGKPKRIAVWYSKDKRKILNAIHFPYEHGRPYYIPFFITEEREGWHQPGLARILSPANIIANSTTNFLLDNAFYRNTPLIRATPNTPIAQQLLAKTWKIGDPLVAEKGEVEPFSLESGSLNDLVTLIKLNEQGANDTSGAPSGYLSGQADPIDPDAPAAKTMALLRETNINIKDFILCLLPSFQEMAYQVLQLFAQFRGTAQYQLKRQKVVGKPIFEKITPDQLRLRTNVTPNAFSFSFDRINERRENLALVQMLTTNPLSRDFLTNAPQARWNLFHILIKSWSDRWNAKVDEIWPTEQQVKDFLTEIQKQAFEKIYQQKVKEFQTRQVPGQGGGPPPEEMMAQPPGMGPSPAPTGTLETPERIP